MKALVTAFLIALLPASAFAGEWTLSASDSKVSYGSIKNDAFGEVNTFTGLSGTVSAKGDVAVSIDLTSVETLIDIRNERMIKYVFGDFANAKIMAKIDIAKLEAMKPGDIGTLDVEGVLEFLGQEVEIAAPFFVARLSEDRAVVTTDEMIMISTDDLGVEAGIAQLQKIASLDGITRVAPVTLRLVFDRTGEGS